MYNYNYFIIGICIFIIFLIFILQIVICKKYNNKKLELILPLIAFIIGILPLICAILFILINIIFIDFSKPNLDILFLFQNIFSITIICLIPFFILISIYYYFKNKARI